MNLPVGIDARLRAPCILLLAALSAGFAAAATFSETGIFSTPEDVATFSLNLAAGGDITLQTWGFGGGVNAAGTVIPAGGFDPFVGIFAGTGPDAVFLSGDSDILSDYTPGCPPAGTLTIGSVPGQCGDVSLEVDGLAPGAYTVLLTDGSDVPEAVFESSPGYLGDGFVDLTGGAFQTCYDASDCNNDTAAWALDITAPQGSLVTPEPSSFWLAGLTLGALALRKPKETSQK
jgi:hypothetical protein